MTQYIDKDTVIAEIEKRIEHCAKQKEGMLNVQCYTLASDMNERMGELNYIKDFIDSLEVKKIDLEDNIKENLAQNYLTYISERHNINPK